MDANANMSDSQIDANIMSDTQIGANTSPPPQPDKRPNAFPNRVYCCVYGCLKNTKSDPDLSFFTVPRKDQKKRTQWLQIVFRNDLIEKNTICRVCETHFYPDDILLTSCRKRLKRDAVPRLNLPCETIHHKETQTHVIAYNISTQTYQNASVKLENVRMINTSCQTDQIVTVKLENETTDNLPCQTDETACFASANIIQTASLSTDTPQKRKLESQSEDSEKLLKLNKTEKTEIKSEQGEDLELFHRLCDRFLSNKLAKLVKARSQTKSNPINQRT